MKCDNWKIPNVAASRANVPRALLKAGYPPLLAAMLASRGLAETEAAEAFLGGGPEQLHNPSLMADMDRAVARIKRAAELGEHVAVYGDYDVDGMTSACLMTDCLRFLGLACALYIPDRIGEGYGLNPAAISRLHGRGVSLIVTVDCGVTGIEETAHAKSLGMDMVITDHHECRPELPAAAAVVDPKRPDCPYPEKSLAGVGVAFKLACALLGGGKHTLDRYADLVAVGTIADVMPLTGENRYMIREGLYKLLHSPRPGLAALMREAGVEGKRLTATTVGFSIAPRLNAAGRLGRSDVAAELLLSRDEKRCASLAGELCRLNRERQSIELGIWEQAVSMLGGKTPETPIVLACENWHQGVVGIAASRLTEVFSLPTVMISLDGEMGKGSCRSSGGFNLFEALLACESELESFGGHALAAGLNIRRDRVDSFRSALAEYYKAHKPEDGPELRIDVCIGDGSLLDMENVASLERLEPSGGGNPRALLCLTGARLEGVTPIGGGKHVKLKIRKFDIEYDCVFFSQRAEELEASCGDRVDVAFYPQINEFRGRSAVQLLVLALRKADEGRLCRRILMGEPLLEREAAELLPGRGDFIRLWKRLTALGGALEAPLEEALELLDTGGEAAKDCLCLMVFSELGLLGLDYDGKRLSLAAGDNRGKTDLESSERLKSLREFVAKADLAESAGR